MAITARRSGFQQQVRYIARTGERNPARCSRRELSWTKYDSELMQEAIPGGKDDRASMDEWTADMDAEADAIHADLFGASLRALPDY